MRNHRPMYASAVDEVLSELAVDLERGLSETDVRARLARYGPNRLRRILRRSAWEILRDQFRSVLVALLAVAAALSFGFGSWVEGLAILAVLAINGAIGFATELRAVRSMEALRALGSVRATVRRDGRVRDIEATALVPGDVVVLEGGDVVTADLRVVRASKLQADESTLTGESVAVGKGTEPVAIDAPLVERRNMLFKGTAVTRGAAEGVVVATGMQTELGRISQLVESARDEVTPLEQRLDRLGQRLVWVTLLIAGFVAATGIAAGRDWLLIFETAIALAVATVPEGLPIIATLALARGMHRMARRHALVNRLSAVETLGATSIIFTDKTGTLTENRMTVTELALASGAIRVSGEGLSVTGDFEREGRRVEPREDPLLLRALEIGVLCNDASFGPDQSPVGDPLEVALLVAGLKAGLARASLLERSPERREEAFDPAVKMMATVHDDPAGGLRVAVKGAPETVLAACRSVLTAEGERTLDDPARGEWERRNREMARRGLRVLGLATRHTGDLHTNVYEDLVFVGLVGLLDPPRSDVRAAIEDCRRAGIRVVMVTGDQVDTARTIAHAVGLVDDEDAPVVLGRDLATACEGDKQADARLDARIFARVSPEQKLQLIAHHQRRGAIVAMTGDGVNDAPALEKADIGVAMGRRGTEVARQAAEIVLRDDAFSTIVAAVQQGRVIFANIRTFVVYLLSCNISEILVVGLASMAHAPLPLLPLQILYLNLVTDVFPALALGVSEGEADAMEHPPRPPGERVLEARHWRAIAVHGAWITMAVLGALGIALGPLGLDERQAVTVSFLTLAWAQIAHVFNMRGAGSGVFSNRITRNPYVWGAIILCVALLWVATYLPGLAALLDIVPPDARGWAVIVGMGLVPLVAGQVFASLGLGPSVTADRGSKRISPISDGTVV